MLWFFHWALLCILIRKAVVRWDDCEQKQWREIVNKPHLRHTHTHNRSLYNHFPFLLLLLLPFGGVCVYFLLFLHCARLVSSLLVEPAAHALTKSMMFIFYVIHFYFYTFTKFRLIFQAFGLFRYVSLKFNAFAVVFISLWHNRIYCTPTTTNCKWLPVSFQCDSPNAIRIRLIFNTCMYFL